MKTVNIATDNGTSSIDWSLSLSTRRAVDLLNSIVDKRSLKIHEDGKYPNQIRFKFYLKRSIIWGAGFRKEIEAEGVIEELTEGSRMTAAFRICSPYRYVKLNVKTGASLFLICFMSLLGLFFDSFIKPLKYASPYLEFLLFGSGFILLTGAHRLLVIESKLSNILKIFHSKFDRFIIKP